MLLGFDWVSSVAEPIPGTVAFQGQARERDDRAMCFQKDTISRREREREREKAWRVYLLVHGGRLDDVLAEPGRAVGRHGSEGRHVLRELASGELHVRQQRRQSVGVDARLAVVVREQRLALIGAGPASGAGPGLRSSCAAAAAAAAAAASASSCAACAAAAHQSVAAVVADQTDLGGQTVVQRRLVLALVLVAAVGELDQQRLLRTRQHFAVEHADDLLALFSRLHPVNGRHCVPFPCSVLFVIIKGLEISHWISFLAHLSSTE